MVRRYYWKYPGGNQPSDHFNLVEPSQAALKSALTVVDRLLDRERENNGGKYPETIALVLWGTDNIKTYGESLAQVMMMVGIRPVPDALGRVNKLEVSEAGRACMMCLFVRV